MKKLSTAVFFLSNLNFSAVFSFSFFGLTSGSKYVIRVIGGANTIERCNFFFFFIVSIVLSVAIVVGIQSGSKHVIRVVGGAKTVQQFNFYFHYQYCLFSSIVVGI